MNDIDYMKRAIELAEKGRGFTNPNPMVGAVIVKDGRIIGEGYHQKYGQPHAERNAIGACTQSPQGASIYVTLEPCCHYGKTPPCTEAILEAGITRVVIGSRDPNPKVAGKGAAILREAKIQVEMDFMKTECDALNPVFFHYIRQRTPYVVMKYAMTADGKIATYTGDSQWITGKKAREHVHQLRHAYSGIMTGIGTVLADDPLLTCRLKEGNSPVRIICDSKLNIPLDSRLVKSAKRVPVIIATAVSRKEKERALRYAGVQVLHVPDKVNSTEGRREGALGYREERVDLKQLMIQLGDMGIDSILLEGGETLNASALEAGIVRKCCVYIGAKMFGGVQAKGPVGGQGAAMVSEAVSFCEPVVTSFGKDILLEYAIENEREDEGCSQEL